MAAEGILGQGAKGNSDAPYGWAPLKKSKEPLAEFDVLDYTSLDSCPSASIIPLLRPARPQAVCSSPELTPYPSDPHQSQSYAPHLTVPLTPPSGSMFLPPTTALGAGVYSLAMYGGLVLFSMMLLYDTQRIIKKAETYPMIAHKPFDPINA